MKIDLHVHSKHSTRPSQWFLQKLGCPESFTEPRRLYDIAKARGMDMVTIADHNTINGALEIAHLPDAFMEFYARQIATMTARTVRVAAAGMPVLPNHIYLAPGDDRHLTVSGSGTTFHARLRPGQLVDVMLPGDGS